MKGNLPCPVRFSAVPSSGKDNCCSCQPRILTTELITGSDKQMVYFCFLYPCSSSRTHAVTFYSINILLLCMRLREKYRKNDQEVWKTESINLGTKLVWNWLLRCTKNIWDILHHVCNFAIGQFWHCKSEKRRARSVSLQRSLFSSERESKSSGWYGGTIYSHSDYTRFLFDYVLIAISLWQMWRPLISPRRWVNIRKPVSFSFLTSRTISLPSFAPFYWLYTRTHRNIWRFTYTKVLVKFELVGKQNFSMHARSN